MLAHLKVRPSSGPTDAVEGAASEKHGRAKLGKKLQQDFPFKDSYTPPSLDLSPEELQDLREFQRRVLSNIPDCKTRCQAVAFNGDKSPASAWWNDADSDSPEPIDQFEGGRLLWDYYVVISGQRLIGEPGNLSQKIKYPVRLSKEKGKKGCAIEDCIAHSLHWREQYQPWRVTDSMRLENKQGFCYVRGFSPAPPHCDGRHSVLYLRLGKTHMQDDGLTLFRVMINAMEIAVSRAMNASDGKVAKFNVVLDCEGFDMRKLPDLARFKQFVNISNDQHTNRVGTILLANLSRAAQLMANMVKAFASKEMQDKVVVLSTNPARRQAQLEKLIEPEFIPEWLGGTDAYDFDADEYYGDDHNWSDEEALAWTETLPHYALNAK